MKNEKLNCEKARCISIVQILAKLGHFPKRKTEKESWYLSPFRSETQASFKVSLKQNYWMDFGTFEGGNVIDLVVKLNNCSVKDALNYLSGSLNNFSYQYPQNIVKGFQKTKIIKTQPIQHPGLIEYIESRKIPIQVARKYCKEVWYQSNAKQYFAIGLQNHLGAWELRNRYFKNCSSPKTYTYLKKFKEQLVIIEGMFDLLSLAELAPNLLNKADIIVLNSIAFVKSIEKHLKIYTEVHLYLDNDTAGRKATAQLMSCYNNTTDYSYCYKDYEDLNEFLNHGNELQ